MEGYDQETALAELARRLVPDDPTLVEEVLLAVRDPVSFRERFPERVEQRMWDAWEPFEPWVFGLVDGLVERQRAGAFDWRSGPEEIVAALEVDRSPLPPDPRRWRSVEQLWDPLLLVNQRLQLVADQLTREGWVRGNLDTDADEYTLVVLAAADAGELQLLARRAVSGRIRGLLLPPCNDW